MELGSQRTFWALGNPKSKHWVGAGDVPRFEDKFTWFKARAVLQLSEGAVLVKAFRYKKLMFVKSCEDESPED